MDTRCPQLLQLLLRLPSLPGVRTRGSASFCSSTLVQASLPWERPHASLPLCPSHEGPPYSAGSSRTVSSLMARQLVLSGIPVSRMPLGNQPLAPFVWTATSLSGILLRPGPLCARSVAVWMPLKLGQTETLSLSAKPGWRMTLGPNEENIGLLFRPLLLPQLVPW